MQGTAALASRQLRIAFARLPHQTVSILQRHDRVDDRVQAPNTIEKRLHHFDARNSARLNRVRKLHGVDRGYLRREFHCEPTRTPKFFPEKATDQFHFDGKITIAVSPY